MNPLQLMQLKSLWERFHSNHPKFPAFLNAVHSRGIQEGTILEFRVITPSGEELTSNLKVQSDDIALFREVQELMRKQ